MATTRASVLRFNSTSMAVRHRPAAASGSDVERDAFLVEDGDDLESAADGFDVFPESGQVRVGGVLEGGDR